MWYFLFVSINLYFISINNNSFLADLVIMCENHARCVYVCVCICVSLCVCLYVCVSVSVKCRYRYTYIMKLYTSTYLYINTYRYIYPMQAIPRTNPCTQPHQPSASTESSTYLASSCKHRRSGYCKTRHSKRRRCYRLQRNPPVRGGEASE